MLCALTMYKEHYKQNIQDFRADVLADLPEELDVCIAQRDFDNAVRKLRNAKVDIAK